MIQPALKFKFTGALLGTAVGDAIGAFFEGQDNVEPDEIVKTVQRSSLLRYTDDTHMTIGVAESLIHSGGFDAEDMLRHFIRNYEAEPNRGYAAGPPYIFERVKRGSDWRRVSKEMYQGGSFGNGAAMRVAPVGLLYQEYPDILRQAAYGSAEITHSHPLGKEGAAVQAYAVALAAGMPAVQEFSKVDFISDLRNFSLGDVYDAKLEIIDKFAEEMSQSDISLELGNGIEAFNSVPTAIYSFLYSPESFSDAILRAVSLGGDTDTIGAMTGAIAGAYWGIEGIPQEWLRKLENRGMIETLAEQLFAIKIEMSRR